MILNAFPYNESHIIKWLFYRKEHASRRTYNYVVRAAAFQVCIINIIYNDALNHLTSLITIAINLPSTRYTQNTRCISSTKFSKYYSRILHHYASISQWSNYNIKRLKQLSLTSKHFIMENLFLFP